MSSATPDQRYLESSPRRKLPFKRSAAAVIAAAVIASGAVTGLLYAVGLVGGSTSTVLAQAPQTSDGSSPDGTVTPSSLFASAAPGVVAIEATGTNAGSNGLPYTPPGQSIDTGTGMVINTQGDVLTA